MEEGGWKFGLQHGRGVLLKKDGDDPEIVKERGVWVEGKKKLSLKQEDTDWPPGVDEVDMDMFPDEPEEPIEKEEEGKEEGNMILGKIGDLLGNAGDIVKTVVTVHTVIPHDMEGI